MISTKVALGALQAMSIATGLVYTILMCIACQVQNLIINKRSHRNMLLKQC